MSSPATNAAPAPLILTTDEARALSALRISGRRLIRAPTGWQVLARGDARTRPLATLDDASTARLLAAGRLSETDHGALILGDAHAPAARTSRSGTPPDRAFLLATTTRPASRAPGFLGLARKAERGDGPLSPRQIRAGLALIRDAEAATRQSGLVMDPASPMRDRDVRRTWRGGGVDAGARARASLRRLRAQVTEAAFALGWSACVDARSLTWLARRHIQPRDRIGKALACALEDIADGYGL